MEIVSVSSDLGGTTSVTRPIGRHTIVAGRNQSGKTRLLNAIALSLTGGLDDFLGRGTAGSSGKPVRSTTEVARYIGPGRDSFSVGVTFDSGETASYALTRNGRSGEVAKTVSIPGAFRDRAGDPAWTLMPVREVHAKLAAGPDKARAFFLPYIVPADVLAASLTTALTDEDRKRLRERGLNPPADFEGVTGLIAACDSNAADCTTTADNTRRSADQLAATINRPTDAAIAAAEAIATAARNAYNAKLQSGFRMTAAPEALEAEIAGLQQQAVTLSARWSGYAPGVFPPAPVIPTMEAAIGPVPPNIQAVQSWLTDLGEPTLALVTRSHAAGAACCSTCGSATNTPGLVQYWTAQVNTARAELGRISAEWDSRVAWYRAEVARTNVAHDEACAAVRDRDAAYRVDLGSYNTISAQLQAKIAARATLATASPEDADQTPISVYEQRTHAADQALAGLRESASTWTSIDQSRERAALLTTTAAWWLDLRDRLKSWSEKLIRESLADFTARVSRYLPETWGQLTIALENDTGSRTFRIGFIRGGHEVISICGGEWAAVVLAISAVILDRDRPTYGVLTLVSDMGWHPDVLATVMQGLRDCPWQIVIASCVVPPAVEGWDILMLEDTSPVYESTPALTTTPGTEPPPSKPRKPRTPRTPKGQDTAMSESTVSVAQNGQSQEDSHAAHQRTTVDLQEARAQYHGLLALGWSEAQIHRMSPASLKTACDQSYTPETHSVLADGSIYNVNPPSLDALRSPRSH